MRVLQTDNEKTTGSLCQRLSSSHTFSASKVYLVLQTCQFKGYCNIKIYLYGRLVFLCGFGGGVTRPPLHTSSTRRSCLHKSGSGGYPSLRVPLRLLRSLHSLRSLRSLRFTWGFPSPPVRSLTTTTKHLHTDTLRKLAKLACFVPAFASLMQGEERESGGLEQAPLVPRRRITMAHYSADLSVCQELNRKA